MDEALTYTLLTLGAIIFVIGFIGYNIGYSQGLSDCDKNPQNVEYWKAKYIETQKENELLRNQVLDVLVNSYAKKIVYSASGLNNYKAVCLTNYSQIGVPELTNIFDIICRPLNLNNIS